jgi:hypothetical protein
MYSLAVVSSRTRKTRTVADALNGSRWIRDISGSLSTAALVQYIQLWDRLQSVDLNDGVPNKFVWKWIAPIRVIGVQGHSSTASATSRELASLAKPERRLDVSSLCGCR